MRNFSPLANCAASLAILAETLKQICRTIDQDHFERGPPLMIAPPDWTRRQFLTGSAVAAASIGSWQSAFARAQAISRSAPNTSRSTAFDIQPLLESNTARPLRYTPENRTFRIRNGKEFFNRPLYGPNNAFRIDAGDLPEFSLYLPGHGGNLRLGISRPSGSKWALPSRRGRRRLHLRPDDLHHP